MYNYVYIGVLVFFIIICICLCIRVSPTVICMLNAILRRKPEGPAVELARPHEPDMVWFWELKVQKSAIYVYIYVYRDSQEDALKASSAGFGGIRSL